MLSIGKAMIELDVDGMSCASCVGRVEAVLKAVPGVANATVNFATERASVHGDAEMQALIAALIGAGYAARPTDRRTNDAAVVTARKDAERAALGRALAVAILLTLPVFALEMGSHLFPVMHELVMQTIGMQESWYIQFFFATLVIVWPGACIQKNGLRKLAHLTPDMDSLVAVGSLAAYLYSTVATFAPSLLPAGTVNVYYEAASVIISLILLGRCIEARAKGRTSQAIRRLVSLQPRTAHVRRGPLTEIDVADVMPGDIVELRPGERVPVDGVVIEGKSRVDESMITGEPISVAKVAGSTVVGGTINQLGVLTVRATAVGSATVLSQIIRMVEQAQSSKLPIQALVDRVTIWFVPAVMGFAVLTFLIWLVAGPEPALAVALVNAVSVLIIACPCAMGLATPTSIMVGLGRGTEMGVLFRRTEALQLLKDAKVIALDKTGTLTRGRPVLTDLEIAAGFDRTEVLARIVALEAASEHPVARAIVAAGEAQGSAARTVCGFESVTGFGVRATVSGERVEIGAEGYMRRLGVEVAVFSEIAERLAHDGKSLAYVAIGGRIAALAAVADPVNETAQDLIAALHRLGLQTVMITGDDARAAAAIARGLGIERVVAEVLPGGKVETIQRLRAEHGRVVFVGDGINDAPALAAADVGMAMGTGTDIAIEAADVILMPGSLTRVADAIALSRATVVNIRQNLFWAFAYNGALIPLAAGAFFPGFGLLLSPTLAAGAMMLSSVFVLVNALRLRAFLPPPGAESARTKAIGSTGGRRCARSGRGASRTA